MDGVEAAETRVTMRWVLDQAPLMLHPIMPFITEELWALTAERGKMLVHGDWPTYGVELIDPEADREMNWVISLIDEIRSARTQMRVPVRAQAWKWCRLRWMSVDVQHWLGTRQL